MTGPNREANAAAEMRRAEEAMIEAEALAKAGLYNGATSRAYYVAFHSANAILVHLGVQARTHRGIQALLERHAVQPGLLAREHLSGLARLQERRSVADYGVAEDVTAEQMVVILADARTFLDAARVLLDR
jgi:uncharacterized protein (UPF0332 family)